MMWTCEQENISNILWYNPDSWMEHRRRFYGKNLRNFNDFFFLASFSSSSSIDFEEIFMIFFFYQSLETYKLFKSYPETNIPIKFMFDSHNDKVCEKKKKRDRENLSGSIVVHEYMFKI